MVSIGEQAVWSAAEAAGVVPTTSMPAAFDRALTRWNASGPKTCGHPGTTYVAELSESTVLCLLCAALHAPDVRPRCACCMAEGVELVSGAVSGIWHGLDLLISFGLCRGCMTGGTNDDNDNE